MSKRRRKAKKRKGSGAGWWHDVVAFVVRGVLPGFHVHKNFEGGKKEVPRNGKQD